MKETFSRIKKPLFDLVFFFKINEDLIKKKKK
jgi:hypothetical protein